MVIFQFMFANNWTLNDSWGTAALDGIVLSVERNREIWNSRIVVDSYSIGGELHCSALIHKEDGADGGKAINHSAPHVDVKALIAVLADRGHHMVTGGFQLVESPIKGLPVIVSPSCAHSFTVGCITCKSIIVLIYFFFFFFFACHCVPSWICILSILRLPDFRLRICRGIKFTAVKRRNNHV